MMTKSDGVFIGLAEESNPAYGLDSPWFVPINYQGGTYSTIEFKVVEQYDRVGALKTYGWFDWSSSRWAAPKRYDRVGAEVEYDHHADMIEKIKKAAEGMIFRAPLLPNIGLPSQSAAKRWGS